jgi:hypothetical protein
MPNFDCHIEHLEGVGHPKWMERTDKHVHLFFNPSNFERPDLDCWLFWAASDISDFTIFSSDVLSISLKS